MARSHARFELALFSTDRDPDLAALSRDAKLLYVVIVTDPALNFAGVVVLRAGVWEEEASLEPDEFDRAFDDLQKTRFIVVDGRTSELLVRSFIRNDGVANQPNVLKGALAQARQVRSRLIRRELATELRRLPPKLPDKVGKNNKLVTYPDPHACADVLDPADGPDGSKSSSNSSRNPSPNPSGNPSSNPSDGTLPGRVPGTPGGRGRGRGSSHLPENSSSEELSSSAIEIADATTEPGRGDVDQLVTRLRDRVADNGFKTPGGDLAAWRRQARLLLDRDKRELEQALRLIDWATNHHFWLSVIQSMPKFREKYDQLLAQARQEQRGRPTPARRTTDDKRAAIPGLVAEVLGSSALRPDLRSITGGGQP